MTSDEATAFITSRPDQDDSSKQKVEQTCEKFREADKDKPEPEVIDEFDACWLELFNK